MILYVVAFALLFISLLFDKRNSIIALNKAWKIFADIFPTLLGILFFIGLILTIAPPAFINQTLGQSSGLFGMLLTSIIGSITFLPAFIAFPMAASLLKSGAGIMQIAIFVSTLTMVGVVTAPLEARYFGWKFMLFRNGFSYLFSFVVAMVIGAAIL